MQQPDLSQVLALLRSPAGQQLADYFKQQGGDTARSAAAKASAGDLDGARRTLAPLLETPEFQALLKQLGGSL